MLTAFVVICGFVWLYCSAANGEWGTFAIGAVIAVVIIGMIAGDRKDMRAFFNFRDYWADGGPRRRK